MQAITKKIRAEQSAAYIKMLKLMYFDFSSIRPPVIDIQVVKDHLEKYGGYVTEESFRENALNYEPK